MVINETAAMSSANANHFIFNDDVCVDHKGDSCAAGLQHRLL